MDTEALLALACGAALVVASVAGHFAPATERAAFLAAMAIGLVPIARRAPSAARLGTPFSIETLMTVAAVRAVSTGATGEAATVVFLFLLGEVLEGFAAGRARTSIRGLTGLVSDTALLEPMANARRYLPRPWESGRRCWCDSATASRPTGPSSMAKARWMGRR